MSFQGTLRRAGLTTSGKNLNVIDGVLTYQLKPIGRLIKVQIVNSSPITNTAIETEFDQKAVILANTLKVGDVIRVRTSGIVTNTNAADTLLLRLKFVDQEFSNVFIQSTLAVNVSDNDIWALDATLTVGSVDGSGIARFRGSVLYQDPGVAGIEPKIARVPAAAVSSNRGFPFSVGMTAQWSNADPGNSCRQETLVVEVYENR